MDIARIAGRVYSEKEPEAPAWAPFGSFAWAPQREGMPEEPNTAVEDQVYADIQSHFSNKREGVPATTACLLRLMMMLGWYKQVLHAPPLTRVYRGLKLRSASAAAEFIGVPVGDLAESGRIELEVPRPFVVLNGHSTSWSAKKMITRDFSERGERGWAITLIAEVADNPFAFLAGPGGLYDVDGNGLEDGLSMYHLERETVGLEPIAVRRVEWTKL